MSTTTVATLATTITTARWPDRVTAVNEPNVNILGPITSWPGMGVIPRERKIEYQQASFLRYVLSIHWTLTVFPIGRTRGYVPLRLKYFLNKNKSLKGYSQMLQNNFLINLEFFSNFGPLQ